MCSSSDCRTFDDLIELWGILTELHVSKRKKRDGEQAEDASLTLVSEIDRVMKCAIDTPVAAIGAHNKCLRDLNSKFGLLLVNR